MKKCRVQLLLCLVCIMMVTTAGAALAAERTYKMKVDGCWT